MDANSATIIVSSDPITIKLNTGEEKKVDVDGDGTYDVYVKLNSVTNSEADLTIKQTSEAVPAGGGTVSGGTGLPEEEGGGDVSGKSNTLLGIILGVILIAIIVVAAVMMNKKKK